jgi:hypothetical protein
MTGYINVTLFLQSSSDSLHILPGSSNEINATPDGVCNFSNTEVEEDVDIIEEVSISINGRGGYRHKTRGDSWRYNFS